MKTTLDLPEELVREMKVRAAQEGKKLREVASEVMRRGLAVPGIAGRKVGMHRVKLPLVPARRKAPKLKVTPVRIHELEMEALRESHEASLRH